MKKILTVVIAITLMLCACVSLVACGKGSTTVDPREGKTIVVGYTDYAPMNFTEDNQFKGFDTELAIMTFEALGYNVRFKLIEWDNKYIELNGNTIDCVWNGFTSNGDDDGVPRSQSVDFTYNYMQNAQCIVRKSSTAEATKADDFSGKTVSFENGSSGESYATDENNMKGIMPQGKKSQMEAITAVNMGAASYAVVDVLLADSLCGKGEYADLVKNDSIKIDIEYYAVGFKKGSELTAKVNTMFETFAKTGVLKAIAEKYSLGTAVITDFTSQK